MTISNLSSVSLKEDNGERPIDLKGLKVQFKDADNQIFWDAMLFNDSGNL